MCPCRALTNGLFFRQIFRFYFYFLGILRSYGTPHFRRKNKNKKNQSWKARQGHVQHVCKISGSITLEKDVDIWTCVRLCTKITAWHRNYLVLGFSLCSILGVKIDLILVLWSQFFEFLRETLYKHALEHLEAAGPETKGSFIFLPTVNA